MKNKMCFNEPMSWSTLVLGSLVNAALLRKLPQDSPVRAAVINWQFGLMMQLGEAMVYRTGSKSAVELAFWLNVLQPVAAYVGFMPHMHNPELVGVLVVAYVALLVWKSNKVSKQVFLPDCSHISLTWWRDRNMLAGYFVTMIAVLYNIRDDRVRHTCLAIFWGTLVVTHYLYPCSFGSMWCWSIASAGLVTYVATRD